jgi:hypothetical protein
MALPEAIRQPGSRASKVTISFALAFQPSGGFPAPRRHILPQPPMIAVIVSVDRIDNNRMTTISLSHIVASARPSSRQGPHRSEAKTQGCAQNSSKGST